MPDDAAPAYGDPVRSRRARRRPRPCARRGQRVLRHLRRRLRCSGSCSFAPDVAAQRAGLAGGHAPHRSPRRAGPDRRHEPRPAALAHRLVDRRATGRTALPGGNGGAHHSRARPPPRRPAGEATSGGHTTGTAGATATHARHGAAEPEASAPAAADPLRVLIVGDSLGLDLGGAAAERPGQHRRRQGHARRPGEHRARPARTTSTGRRSCRATSRRRTRRSS